MSARLLLLPFALLLLAAAARECDPEEEICTAPEAIPNPFTDDVMEPYVEAARDAGVVQARTISQHDPFHAITAAMHVFGETDNEVRHTLDSTVLSFTNFASMPIFFFFSGGASRLQCPVGRPRR